jgi:tetratricopeptide (TPR) repeat protein
MTARTPAWPWLGLLALWAGAFVLACHLLQHPLLPSVGQLSGWAGLLTAGRTEMGRSLYGRADVYFHCGVEPLEQHAFTSFLDRWFKVVAPTGHRHAADASGLETLPWLRWATEMDPDNVNAWLDAAYAAEYAQEFTLSLKILGEALRHNPTDDRLYGQRAHLLLHMRNFDKAARAFDLALRFLPQRSAADAGTQRQAAIAYLKKKALCEELLGHRELALAHLRQCVDLEPDRAATRDWLMQLESGCQLRADAEQRLTGILHAKRPADPDERHEPPQP